MFCQLEHKNIKWNAFLRIACNFQKFQTRENSLFFVCCCMYLVRRRRRVSFWDLRITYSISSSVLTLCRPFLLCCIFVFINDSTDGAIYVRFSIAWRNICRRERKIYAFCYFKILKLSVCYVEMFVAFDCCCTLLILLSQFLYIFFFFLVPDSQSLRTCYKLATNCTKLSIWCSIIFITVRRRGWNRNCSPRVEFHCQRSEAQFNVEIIYFQWKRARCGKRNERKAFLVKLFIHTFTNSEKRNSFRKEKPE